MAFGPAPCEPHSSAYGRRIDTLQGDGRRGRRGASAGAIARKLGADGHDVEVARASRSRVIDAPRRRITTDWDVVLLDVGLPGMSGIDVLQRFREVGSLASVIMLTGDNSAATATTCMRAGAFYYLTKPFRAVRAVGAMVESAARHSTLRRELAGVAAAARSRSGRHPRRHVGRDAPAARRARSARRAGRLDPDPGRERHRQGAGRARAARARRARRKRFVALNCGAIPESLIDSELFGHAKGAFTGATTRSRRACSSRPTAARCSSTRSATCRSRVQARLLRVLQESEVRPVGGSGVGARSTCA